MEDGPLDSPLDNAVGDYNNDNDAELSSLGAKIRDLSAQSDSDEGVEGGISLGCSPIEGEGRFMCSVFMFLVVVFF